MALGVLFELFAVSAVALIVLAVAVALSLLKSRRQLAKQAALAAVGGTLGLLAAQALTTVLAMVITVTWRQLTRTGADPGMISGLLTLGTIAVATILGALDGASCGWRMGAGKSFGAVLSASWTAWMVRKFARR